MSCSDCHTDRGISRALSSESLQTPKIIQDLTSNKTLISVIKIVARVAILALALYLRPYIATFSFALGLAWGVYAQHAKLTEPGDGMPVCGKRYAEFCADNKIPPVLDALITGAVVVDCLYHATTAFNLIVSMSVGFYFGTKAVWYAEKYLR